MSNNQVSVQHLTVTYLVYCGHDMTADKQCSSNTCLVVIGLRARVLVLTKRSADLVKRKE